MARVVEIPGMRSPPPLRLERKLDSRLWGGRALAPYLGLAQAPERLAEVWLVYEENRVGRRAAQDGTLLELVRRIPARAGDTVLVEAGTVHAINAGVMLFEIQQKSDLTYRLYDYGRTDAAGKPRELHLDRALDVLRYGAAPPRESVAPAALGPGRELLVRCAHFAMEKLWGARVQ